jgi:hypothetical protein
MNKIVREPIMVIMNDLGLVRNPFHSTVSLKITLSGLNGVVVCIAYCYPKGAAFDSRVILGIFPLRKRGLRTLV